MLSSIVKEQTEHSERGLGVRQRVGLVAGPVLLVLMLLLPAPEGLSLEGWRVAGVGVLMATWWIAEALPIPITALLPLVLFPVLGITGIDGAAAPYANPLIFLFMGGFLIALAMQRWELHRRVALRVIANVGTEPRSIIMGFMAAAAFLSMWVSNTATAVMLLPVGLSVLELAHVAKDNVATSEHRNFAIGLMLSIAYACNIGGLGTLIGTPPNALLAGFMNETYGVEVGFAQWMLVGVPIALVGLGATYFLLTRVLFPPAIDALPGGRALIDRELRRLGPVSAPERRVAVVFCSVALLWMTRPLLEGGVPGLSDAGIAMMGAVLLFILPAGTGGEEDTVMLMDWDTAVQLPWDVLLLFGGGLSLAEAISDSGLAAWIGQALGGAADWPLPLTVLVLTAMVVVLTELASNTASAAALLPIVASVAVGLGQNPFVLVVPVALAASCAFMLPVATPPNAVVYGSGVLTIPDMARAGLLLNVLFVVLITGVTYLLVLTVFGITLGEVPPWAG